jgi:hypothetical protein
MCGCVLNENLAIKAPETWRFEILETLKPHVVWKICDQPSSATLTAWAHGKRAADSTFIRLCGLAMARRKKPDAGSDAIQC